jgi:hypothetical protein
LALYNRLPSHQQVVCVYCLVVDCVLIILPGSYAIIDDSLKLQLLSVIEFISLVKLPLALEDFDISLEEPLELLVFS